MIKSILKFSVPNIVNICLSLIATFILTRVFAPETYGVLNIFNTTAATVLSIFYFGMDSAYIRFYNEPPHGNSSAQLGSKLLLLCLSSEFAFGTLITLCFYEQLTMSVFGFVSRMICALLFTSVFAQLILRFLNIKHRMDFNTKAYTLQSILIQIALKLFVALAALLSLTIEEVLLVNVLGITILAIVFIVVQRKSFFSFCEITTFKGYKPVIRFALFTAPLAICINLNNFISQQLITGQLGNAGVGIYSSAGYFSGILGALQGGFATFWAAYMYANYKEKQEEIKRVNEYLLLVIIVVFAGLILGKDIIYLLIGEQYHESKSFFSLVLCYPILSLSSETTSYGISIKNKNHLSLVSFVSSILLNLVLAYILLPALGLKGVALASMISGVILYSMLTVFGQRLYKSISNTRLTAIDIVIIIVMSIIPALIQGILMYAIILFLLCIALISNKDQLKEVLNKAKEIIKTGKS